jgi:hypothetical protein
MITAMFGDTRIFPGEDESGNLIAGSKFFQAKV